MKSKQSPTLPLFPPPAPPAAREKDVYTVSRLNREAKTLLEQNLPLLWLEGEISNLSQPSSGHWYFSLKDANAQVRCVMFRQRNSLSQCVPGNGLHVQARVRVSLYEARGEYQLIVEHLEDVGEGRLRRQFELLKAKLEKAGLFAAERKRPLPALPRRIGVVTSPTGAAIRDILHILQRRFPSIPVLIYPTAVQGAAAAQEIASAIRLASRRAECDVLIVARGGGSLEDLWAFNEEVVAHAIFECAIPVVAGIGHEIDFTIADFVADVRAPTPSGAAELTVPDRKQFIEQFMLHTRRLVRAFVQQLRTRETEHGWLKDRLANAVQQHLKDQGTRHTWLAGRLVQAHPGYRLQHQAQRLDDLERRARLAVLHRIESGIAVYNDQRLHLWRLSPLVRLREAAHRTAKLRARLDAATRAQLTYSHRRTDATLRALNAVNPFVRLREAVHRAAVLRNRLDVAIRAKLIHSRRSGDAAARMLNAANPLPRLREAAHHVATLRNRLDTRIRTKLTNTRRHADVMLRALNAVSPLATLERGYAIVTRLPDNTVLRSADEAKVGDRIEARLHHGRVRAVIEEKK